MSGKNGVFGYEIGVSDQKLEKWPKLKIHIFVTISKNQHFRKNFRKISAPTDHTIPRNSNIFEP